MSQIQLHVTTSDEPAERRRWPLIVPVLFTLSFLLVIYYLVTTVVFGVKYFYLLDVEVVHMSILMVMFDLVLGWALLLAGQILASRAVRSDEA
jgi:hypothetical protein